MTRDDWRPTISWWKRPRWIAAIAAFCLVLAGGLVWGLWPEDTSCAAGVRKVGNPVACVGVTDGSFAFSRDLSPVSKLVRDKNRGISGNYISIVYLLPMVPGPTDTTTADSVRREVEGAYTAQVQADDTDTYGDTPKIKLLLANSGTTPEQRTAALDEIRHRIGPDHIVAVAGLGTSTDATADMIRTITKDTADGGLQLGAVSSVLTADTLAGIKGLVRAAPTNKDEAAAAAAFLREKPYARMKVLIVQDVRQDDQYSATLGERFRASMPKDRLVGQVEQYDSSQAGVATAFAAEMPNLCAAKPDVVYFAGRGVNLPKFLAPLRTRGCADRPLIVLSGDDASKAAQSAGFKKIKDALRTSHVRLIYTGLAHPGAWTKLGSAYPPEAVGVFRGGADKNSYPAIFPGEPLDDGQAIMAFDSVLTAVRGARIVSASPESNGVVTGSDMIQIWHNLHNTLAIRGASGYISFDDSGSPSDKAVPLIEITADGAVTTLAVTSAGGKPFVPQDPG